MSYLELYAKNKLSEVKNKLVDNLKECRICPRNCRVNRLEGKIGFCKVGRNAVVNSAFLHFDEEKELVGKGGSGTVFFSHCNLSCLYCQNYTISHFGEGKEIDHEGLAEVMLNLQRDGAQNINFVTPSHVIAQIIEALEIAVPKGLNLPLVYNSAGYDSVKTLKIAEGVFDIYMPDMKYSDNTISRNLSGVSDYWDIAKEAIKEMHRQAGDLIVENGIAKTGLLIRHLVLPNRLAGSFEILDFIKNEISPHSQVNIMPQYYPCYQAQEHEDLDRRITSGEYSEVTDYAVKIGLTLL